MSILTEERIKELAFHWSIDADYYFKDHELLDFARTVAEAAVAADREAKIPTCILERWNIERDGDDLMVCFNHHEKGESCEYERFVRPQPAAAVPEGWKLVPVEPTEGMGQAGHDAWWYGEADEEMFSAVYSAMLAAAPEPTK